jgi:hypothetical protein
MTMLRRLFLLALLLPSMAYADQVPVRYPQGCSRGFLVLKTLEGKSIASGDLFQTSRGDRVTSRLVFHFRDGSVDDDTAIYSQRRAFQLISDHHIQRGPSFPKPIDVAVDVASGTLISRTIESDGHTRLSRQHLDLTDVANGFISTLVQNIPASRPETTVAYVAAEGSSARLVHLKIRPTGAETVSINGRAQKAMNYTIKAEIGGVEGIVAPIIGKQPQDAHIWVLGGPVPAIVAEEAPLYLNGPVWRIELTSPGWPRQQR